MTRRVQYKAWDAQKYKAHPSQRQARFWKKHYKGLDDSHVGQLSTGVLPVWANGQIVCPKPTAISDLEEVPDEQSLSFENHWRAARDKIIDLLKGSKNFTDYLTDVSGLEYSRLSDLTAEVLKRLCKETPGDFLVLPFQSGSRWRGYSLDRVCLNFEKNEFGMCSFLMGCLLVSHPMRVLEEGHYVYCPGEERAPGKTGEFYGAPAFLRYKSQIILVNSHLPGDKFFSASCSGPVSAP